MGPPWCSGVTILRSMQISSRRLNALEGTGCDMSCCDLLCLAALEGHRHCNPEFRIPTFFDIWTDSAIRPEAGTLSCLLLTYTNL